MCIHIKLLSANNKVSQFLNKSQTSDRGISKTVTNITVKFLRDSYLHNDDHFNENLLFPGIYL